MNLLYIDGAARWHFDTEGNVYSDACFNDEVWERYRSCCSHFVAILSNASDTHSPEEAGKSYNRYSVEVSEYRGVPDLYRPHSNFFRLRYRRQAKQVLEKAIKEADRVILRSVSVSTRFALKYIKKYRKPYMVEVTSLLWEVAWYHSALGKLVAFPREWSWKRILRDAPYALYVTQQALQKRYPCGGRTLGCSDAACTAASASVLAKRLERIDGQKDRRIVLGTAAAIDVHYKGQWTVIQALAELKKRGIDRFEYQMIGAGTGNKLRALAEKLGVSDNVHFVGLLSHDKVFDWYDGVDIYVQPSYIEGLCRSIVEAMSRACTIVSTGVGGNPELTAPENLFPKGDHVALADALERLMDPAQQKKSAAYSYERSQEYDRGVLDRRRSAFLKEFMEGTAG